MKFHLHVYHQVMERFDGKEGSCRIYVLHDEVGARGSLVVNALRYKPAGHGFDSQWCQDFSS